MQDLLAQVARHWEAGESTALATVVQTWHSAPQQPGAALLVGPEGITGSVSGGCVEGAVYELAQDVLADGIPQLVRYGVADEEAFEVGLTCGGVLDVFVERIDAQTFPALSTVTASVRSLQPVAVATVIRHPDPSRVGSRIVLDPSSVHGTLNSARADRAIAEDGRGLLAHGTSSVLHYGPDGERLGTGMDVFVRSFAPPPRMVVFGAIDFAAAAARMGSFLGYRVTVCDARPLFATPARFPDADEVVVDWPHRYIAAERRAGRIDNRTVLIVLTHDEKFDTPLLRLVLDDGWGDRQPAYIGAMGSRRTHDQRVTNLREAGLAPHQIGRLRSPIGLNLGSRTPEETAVSIAAEIIAAQCGGDGQPLSTTTGRIHSTTSRARRAITVSA
ncbi:XdhC family protein [Rhodococcus opacus]|uniref:XdhC family protein n=1 Tax=Rhodococcus opacus TaxID=37919 RepID=UPI002236B7B8|nr:XdhC/CoxI family protein [Rhodococcus opacus]UZG55125.1 XdhC family protein [Rhodococcus opacus]